MAVLDPKSNLILYRTYGALNYPSNIIYQRQGLRIIVDDIPNLIVNTMSNDIKITLERAVPYNVYLTPSAPGFEFIPTTIVFLSYLPPTQTFKIKPMPTAVIGSNRITWSKSEDESARFSAVPDSFFTLQDRPLFKEMKLLVGTTISRTALRAMSLPITISLTNPASTPLTVNLYTDKPAQPNVVQFFPQTVTFKPGETSKNFTYQTLTGAVSGLIMLSVDGYYKTIYYVPNNNITFEILDIDTTPPQLLNYYIVDLGRTYMYFRVSASESSWVSYLLTLRGTVTPSPEEVRNSTLRVIKRTKTDVLELQGRNGSNQTQVTKTFIYYDTFLSFTGLEEQTDYILFFVLEDLSGNYITTTTFNFTTLAKYYPARFNIMLKDNVNIPDLIRALGLITGLTANRFVINSAPPKFTIPEATEPEVLNYLANETVLYDLTILPNKTADDKRPIEYVNLIRKSMTLLVNEVPQVVSTYNVLSAAYEITAFNQLFNYAPYVIALNEYTVSFNVSLKRNGTLFGIIMLQGSPRPNPRQMKYGLNSTNYYLNKDTWAYVKFEIPFTNDESSVIYQVITFTSLMDNTLYDVYFVGENDLPVNPDLMDESQIQKVTILTQREIFVISEDYKYQSRLDIPIAIIFTLLLCLLN
eukprot:TRINITY_DN5170_c0_g1_i7.p1 TRINITY_DN5170_c0_g1~~TRINITY_DN5170_c0_g1_i7.p1  ORF type:complete len:641 (-),score=124.40 TRINITY_DN5170_c0_g1_i7:50-1972(-)